MNKVFKHSPTGTTYMSGLKNYSIQVAPDTIPLVQSSADIQVPVIHLCHVLPRLQAKHNSSQKI